MGKLILRGLVLVSVSLNVAFLAVHMPRASRTRSAGGDFQLTAAQVDRMQEVRRQTRSRYDELKSDLSQKQAELINMLKQQDVDRPALNRCLANISTLQLGMQELAVHEILQCKQHLSPHQCNCMLDESAKKMGLTVKDGMVYCEKIKNNTR